MGEFEKLQKPRFYSSKKEKGKVRGKVRIWVARGGYLLYGSTRGFPQLLSKLTASSITHQPLLTLKKRVECNWLWAQRFHHIKPRVRFSCAYLTTRWVGMSVVKWVPKFPIWEETWFLESQAQMKTLFQRKAWACRWALQDAAARTNSGIIAGTGSSVHPNNQPLNCTKCK